MDQDEYIFPRQGFGLDPYLNLHINSYFITPKLAAHRNPSERTLRMLCQRARFDRDKNVLHVKERGVAGNVHYATNIPQEDYQLLHQQIRRYLSSLEHLFVSDGNVGSSNNSQQPVRIFSDSAEVAFMAKKLLTTSHASSREDASPFLHRITVYVASEANGSDFHLPGSLEGKTSFAVTQPNKRNGMDLVLFGATDVNAFKSGLLMVSQHSLLASGTLPIPGHAVEKNGKVSLIVDPSSMFLAKCGANVLENNQLFSAGTTLVDAQGFVSRAFDGINHGEGQKYTNPGDVVYGTGKNEVVLTSLPPHPQHGGHLPSPPTQCIFLSAGKSGKLTAKEALKAYEESLGQGIMDVSKAATVFEETFKKGIDFVGAKKPEDVLKLL